MPVPVSQIKLFPEKSNVAIIIPFYKRELSHLENLSLQRCIEVLGKYPVYAIKPVSLDLSTILKQYPQIEIISFNDDFFQNIKGYNRLMLDVSFYQAFLQFEFMLIHQLDAFVFKNELAFWASKKYDYIGAAWLWDYDYPDWFKETKENFRKFYHILTNVRQANGIPSEKQFQNTVGNGGFSLRRVKKFHLLCMTQAEMINYYNTHDHHYFNEDSFWSIEVNRKQRRLKIPDYKEATRFSIENLPERSMRLINGKLPFGCHAWDKHLDFWRPYFKKIGYTI